MTELLRVSGLCRSYGYRPALADLDLTVRSGELLCVQGPNGAGKSTLLQALISRSPPERGAFFHRGEEVRSQDRRRRYLANMAFLGHNPGVYLELSPLENLRFLASLHDRDVSEERLRLALSECGLADRASDAVRTFSRGMRQRLALARVFLHSPELVLLDEPLTGLDLAGQEMFFGMLAGHVGKGVAALVVTHDEEPFLRLAHRFLFLKGGRLAADIRREDYTQIARDRVRRLLSPVA